MDDEFFFSFLYQTKIKLGPDPVGNELFGKMLMQKK